MTAHRPSSISADEARWIALSAQGLTGPRPARSVGHLLEFLGAIQLDTISILARTQELVPYSRLGSVRRAAVEQAYWGEPPAAFEYWAHAACVLPMESWPMFAFRRRSNRTRNAAQARGDPRVQAGILERLRSEGPLTATELGGARAGGTWWSWSPVKVNLELMLAEGTLVCVRRRGWRRIYDLPERAIPAPLLASDPSDAECLAAVLRSNAATLGLGTVSDYAGQYYLKLSQVREHLEAAGLQTYSVEGWPAPAWGRPEVVAGLLSSRARSRTTLLSPFDSLLWSRSRVKRIFGLHYRLEAYVPRDQRVHGYFSMPLLARGRLAGRVDPAREGDVLVVRHGSWESWAVTHLALALRRAAGWLDLTEVRVAATVDGGLRAQLEAALRL